MTEQPVRGWLFFRGEARTCVAYELGSTYARLHSEGLGLLPIDFDVTFNDFSTVGRCRMVWRWHDDLGVIFEGWDDATTRRLQLIKCLLRPQALGEL
jgi:hypothetical protein